MYAETELAVQNYIDALLFDGVSAPSNERDNAQVLSESQGERISSQYRSQDFAATGQPSDSATVKRGEAFVRHLALAQQGGLSSRGGAVSPYPEWASEEFECLVVSVANLKLAIPSYFVDTWSALDSTPAQHSEDQGVIFSTESAQQSLLVDAAKLIMPERYKPEMRQSYGFQVTLDDCDLALAVDKILGTTVYQPSKIRWRGMHTRRFWLAGTYIEDMCALLDVDALHREVLASDVLDSP